MKPTWRLLAVLNALLAIAALGCGDEGGSGGGCSAPPEKKEEQAAGGGPSGGSGGGGSGSADLTTDRKGKVPKAYARPSAEPAKSTATIRKPVVAVVPKGPAEVKITRRKVDGIADRVELKCRLIAVSPDGKCSGAKNYAEIKERCCPGGLVERCRTTMEGVVLVGRGCEVTP